MDPPIAIVVVLEPPVAMVVDVVVVVGAGGIDPVIGVCSFFDEEHPASSAPETARAATVTLMVRDVMAPTVAAHRGPTGLAGRGTIGRC